MAAQSDEAVAIALTTVLRDHGWAGASSARRLRGALSDVLGADADAHRGLLDALVLAVEDGVVQELRGVGRDGVGAVFPDLVARLCEWGLTTERATWAVQTWAAVLPAATLPPPDLTVPPPALTVPPPDTRPETPGRTTLPPMVTAPSSPAADLRAAAPGPSPDVTQAPALPPRPDGPGVARPPARPSRRGAALVAVAAVLVVLVGAGVAAAKKWTGDEPERRRSTAGSGETSTTPSPEVPPTPAKGGTVVAAVGLSVPATDAGAAMAAAKGGVRITRLGEVEAVGSGDDVRSAPEGGRLVAFKLADWPCDRESCRPWSRLGLRVVVGGDERRLPVADGGDTFVVAVPADVSDVELVMKADKLTQSLSLMTGDPGPDNVAVLARSGRVDRIGDRFSLVERTDAEIDYGGVVTDTVPRDVKVTRAELTFFTVHGRPSSPRRAFLKLRAEYTIPFGPSRGPFAFDLAEVGFVARDGTRYTARDIDSGPGVNAVFEVPADLRGGTFRLGGGSYPTTGDGETVTRTLAERTITVSFD